MKHQWTALTLLAIIWIAGCSTTQDNKELLFNGNDLTGWSFFVADSTVLPADVWSVQDGVIHCKGVPNGYMKTKKAYENYTLHVEWRWAAEPTNSGVLLHLRGEDRIWPNSFECQLMAGNAGDFVLIGPGEVTVGDSVYAITKDYKIISKQQDSSEKEAGEWNVYEITAKGASVTTVVNGVVQNEGTGLKLTSGPIALQSEGSPIEFRNVYIESL